MATYTPVHNFEKPAGTDYYDVGVFNGNMDKAEVALVALSTAVGGRALSNHDHAIGDVTGLQNTLDAKAITATYTAEIPITGWTAGTDQYTIDIAVAGIVAADNPVACPVWSTVAADRAAQIAAWGCVEAIVTAAGSITVYANRIPTTDLNVRLRVVK